MKSSNNIKIANEIVFVTHNKGKVASAQRQLKDINVEIFNYDLSEPRSDNVREIAECKVKEAFEIVKKPCIALDAGFFIDELNGFPKAFVNFCLETIGIQGILKLMKNVKNRKCAFRECLAYYDGVNLLFFDGVHEGVIAENPRGMDTDKKWSDLWYIFIPYGYKKTLAEMSDEERNSRVRCEQNTSAMDEFIDYYHKSKKTK